MRGVLVTSTLLMLTNIVFIGWSLHAGQQLQQPLPAAQPPLSEADLSVTLAGMPDYTGTTPCIDLARFIAAMNLALDSAGVSPPLPDPLSAPATRGDCRLDSPETALHLLPYRRLFRHNGLAPPAAFSYFVLK